MRPFSVAPPRLELGRCKQPRILNPLRLPVPPRGLADFGLGADAGAEGAPADTYYHDAPDGASRDAPVARWRPFGAQPGDQRVEQAELSWAQLLGRAGRVTPAACK